MPIRNGKIVAWKHNLPQFSAITSSEELSVEEKLEQIKELIEKHDKIFGDEGEWFSSQLEDVLEFSDEDQELMIEEGDEVLCDIYNFCDDELIWLGIEGS